ncbi:MAG: alanine:cation symporter family protein [Planctomycetota bacterium]
MSTGAFAAGLPTCHHSQLGAIYFMFNDAKASRPTHLFRIALIVALLAGWPLLSNRPLFAQESPQPPASEPTDVAPEIADPQADPDPVSEPDPTPQAASELPRVHGITPPEEDPTLADRFDTVLSTINNAVFTTLFFDVTFGAFKGEATDDDGNPVLETEADTETASSEFQAILVNAQGGVILDSNGDPKIVTVPAGATYQPLGSDGKPRVKTGDPKVEGPSAPFLVVFLAAGAVFFTFWHGWINIRGFKHAVDVVRGKFSKSDDAGDIPPFRALTSALSATVGLGNIAGVAIAVKTGGPGAIFWMMFLGLFGMTAKFHESSLAQLFRTTNPDGSISGGPMYYLDRGLKQINPGLGGLGKVLAVVFAVFCMCASLGGGNMFQSNQAFEGFYSQFVATESLAEQARDDLPAQVLRPLLNEKQLKALQSEEQAEAGASLAVIRAGLSEQDVRGVLRPSQIETVLDADAVQKDTETRSAQKRNVSIGFGLTFSVLVAVVVIGGITRIGAATSKIVPAMCLLYVTGCLFVILFNIKQVPGHVGTIFTEAFAFESAFGGLIGVLIIGFQRAAFSSESGLGSSAIAHSAAQTKEPIREGFVASLEPFIDTIIICFITAMVVLITDAYIAPELIEETNGSSVTLYAFQQTRLGNFFPMILSVSIVLFAFSTMISWCYYGERAWGYLFSLKSVLIFRLAFVACVFVGAVASLGPVLDFSDAMLLSMALPNIIGGVILAPLVKRKLTEYWQKYRSGAFDQPESDPDQAGADI